MKLVLSYISLCATLSLFGQLPEQWFGHFEGTLTSTNLEGKTISYHMEMDISVKDDSSYFFNIIYGEDTLRQERKYILKHQVGNHYVLDEQNSILLDMTLFNDQLISVFDVESNYLHVSYTISKKGITFELTSSLHADETGGKEMNGENIPIVYSYKTIAHQTAFLKKKK